MQTGSPNEAIQYSVTRYQYDLQGQLKATERPEAYIRILGQDANGYLTENVAGTQVEHWRTGEIGIAGYDAQRATASLAGTGGSVERYEYDSLGRRTRATVTAGDVASETTRTDYDLQGLVVRQTAADGKTSVYAYDEFGRKNYEREVAGRQMSWSYEGARDLVKTHVGLDGVTVSYTYDKAGQLAHQGSSAGQNLDYRYDAQGRVIEIDDHATQTVSTKRYDAAGNVIRERTEVTDEGKTLTVQDNYLRYDAQGRLAQVADTRMKIDYSYDAVGNRTRVRASYRNDSDELRQYDWAYKFDAMNRMEVEDGQLGDDGVARATQLQGREYSYDYAGRKVSASSWGMRPEHKHREYPVNDQYDPDTGVTGERLVVEDEYGIKKDDAGNVEKGYTTETYNWDAAGNLTSIDRDGIKIQRRHYDALGRLVQQETPAELADVELPQGSGTPPDYMPPPPTSGARGAAAMLADLGYAAQTTTLAYEAGSDRVRLQSIQRVGYDPRTSMEDGQLQGNVTYQYNSASGNLETTTSLAFVPGSNHSVTTNTWSAIGDGYRQVRASTQARTEGAVEQHYDANGNLYKLIQTDKTGPNTDRKFFLDAQGRILQSRQLDAQSNIKSGAGMRENFTIVGGQQIARSADDGIEAGYQDAFGQVNAFGTQQASVPRQATGARSYVVQEGDTLQRIAQTVWGDSSLWYLIAEANGLADGSAYDPVKGSGIRAGQVLTLPDAASVGVGSRSSANTLRPYDPTEAIGNTAPNLPPPPRKKGSLFGKLLAMVVAIVVTIVTGGGAIGAMIGNFAGQATAMAAGVQDSINWRGVALSAIGGGVSAGLGSLATPGSFLAEIGPVGRAIAGNVAMQGVAVATGLQSSFNWRSVASSAAGAAIGQAVGGALAGDAMPADGVGPVRPPAFYDMGATGELLRAGITSFAATTAAAVARGGKVTIQQVGVDAFGSIIGNSLVDAMADDPTRVMGAGRASDAGEYSGQGVRLSAAQVDRWGPKFNVPADPLARTDWDLFSGGTPKLGNSLGAYGAYDDVAGFVDPETGATTYPVRTPVIESYPLAPMAPLPRRPMPEPSAGQYVYARVVEAMDSITENLDRMGEDPSTPSALRFAAAMARNPATWIPGAVKGLAGGGGYAFDSQFRSQINTGVGDFFGNDPVGTTRAAVTRYWDENSGLEIARDTFNLVAGGSIGTPLAKLPGLALGETASLLGKAGETGLRWSQRLNDYSFELVSVPSMRYQAGAIGLTVRNLRAEVTQMLPEGFEVQRISRGGAAIVRYGEDSYYSVPKSQYSLIAELRTMDTMGDRFAGQVQTIADRFEPSMLTRDQSLRLSLTPDGWMKDRFMSSYKGSFIHQEFGQELQLILGGSAYRYSTVGPDVVSRIGGAGLKYEITQQTPSLNAIFSHTRKYPDELLRYVTYR